MCSQQTQSRSSSRGDPRAVQDLRQNEQEDCRNHQGETPVHGAAGLWEIRPCKQEDA